MDLESKINIFGIVPGSIVDGPGIRFAIFVQGCSHKCPGCHNPESHKHTNEKTKTIREIIAEFDKAKSCVGVTFSGGEPFDQAEVVGQLAEEFKKKGINIWTYTGYLFEELVEIAQGKQSKGQTKYCNAKCSNGVLKLLNNIDVLVDGKFDLNKKSYEIVYRGSKNQRLIDMKETLKHNKVVEWNSTFQVPERPTSW